MWADEDEPCECKKCKSKNFHQDPDVLDTWFSSGLWPFSTLGWGNENELKNEKWFEGDLAEFYPNNLLITGFDILFFWVARMMFQGENALGKLPFDDIYLHALVKDEFGRKMSKSLGNVIDPLDSINEYSADILRFTLTLLAVQGRDIKLSDAKMKQVRNFTNKLYNASKYLMLNESKFPNLEDIKLETKLGIYINSRFNECVREVRENIDAYRFNDAANTLYKFLWDEFCDWGIELSKADKASVKELGSIFKEAMKLLNPFMPFLSEYLFQELSGTNLEDTKSLMVMSYPEIKERNLDVEKKFELVIEAIVAIRRAKATIDLGNSKIAKAFVKFNEKIDLDEVKEYIKLLAKCEEIGFVDEKIENSIRDVSENLEAFVPLEGLDMSGIIIRLKSQKTKLEKEIAKLSGMLNNQNFVANAPKEVIETNKEALQSAEAKFKKVCEELEVLGEK